MSSQATHTPSQTSRRSARRAPLVVAAVAAVVAVGASSAQACLPTSIASQQSSSKTQPSSQLGLKRVGLYLSVAR